jgi:hypothetical protein
MTRVAQELARNARLADTLVRGWLRRATAVPNTQPWSAAELVFVSDCRAVMESGANGACLRSFFDYL